MNIKRGSVDVCKKLFDLNNYHRWLICKQPLFTLFLYHTIGCVWAIWSSWCENNICINIMYEEERKSKERSKGGGIAIFLPIHKVRKRHLTWKYRKHNYVYLWTYSPPNSQNHSHDWEHDLSKTNSCFKNSHGIKRPAHDSQVTMIGHISIAPPSFSFI